MKALIEHNEKLFIIHISLCLVLVFLHSTIISAAEMDSVVVTGSVMDDFTHHYLKGVHVEAYHLPDSTITDSTTIKDIADSFASDPEAYQIIVNEISERQRKHYELRLPVGHYLLRYSLSGFTAVEKEVNIPAKQFGRRTKEWEVDDITLMREQMHHLKELYVTASRVKMVIRGDTIVYNADAFQLADGSMLDELIKLMPGLEIRNGSEIYHDGVYVPELLLNGRDFFKGDPAVALANLPAFTVKELRVYHRAPDGAYLRKNTATDTLQWNKVLDVLLKHMYVKEWIANAEVGGGVEFGEHERNAGYLGRLFGLRLTEHSHLGTYVNVNNLNDKQGASSQGIWNDPRNELSGTSHVQKGGINYNVEGKKTHIRYNSSLTSEHASNSLQENTSSTTFLQSSDVFSRIQNNRRNDYVTFLQRNGLRYEGKNLSASLNQNWTFKNGHTNGKRLSAQFSKHPYDGYLGACIDSIFTPFYSPYLASIINNRLTITEKQKETRWQINNNVAADYCSPLSGNIISVNAYANYTTAPKDNFDHYDLLYVSAANDTRDFRNRYTSETAHRLSSGMTTGYEGQRIGAFEYSVRYSYDKLHERNGRNLYRFDYLDGYGADSQLPLGMLPSTANWEMRCRDISNSFDSQEDDHRHELRTSISVYAHKDRLKFNASVPILWLKNRYYDTRSNGSDIQKRYSFVNPHLSFRYNIPTHKGENARIRRSQVSFDYTMHHEAPLGIYLINLYDDADPLKIMMGNPCLRPSYTNNARVGGMIQGRIWTYDCQIDYKRIEHAIAYGMKYNRITGAYTYKPENINGNWESGVYFHLVGRSNQSPFSCVMTTDFRYLCNVDLVSSDGISDAILSEVDSRILNDQCHLQYQKGKMTIGLDMNIIWNYATSERAGFKTRSTADLQEGLSLNVANLIYGISVMTDINMYHRFGYEDESMNDHALVWNAQLSRPLDKKGKWNLKLRGYDLLRQLSTVRRTLNSQGIAETWTNTLPSYLMLHVVYHFNKKPQRY